MKWIFQSAVIVCFLAPAPGSSAQDAASAKTVRRSLSKELSEVYQVSPVNKKVKNGTYVVTDDKEVLVKGQYKDGKKDSVWEYYSAGVLVQRYDFSAGRLIYNVGDSASIVKSNYSVKAATGDSDKVEPPYKVGGVNYGFYLLYDPTSLPPDVKGVTSNVQMTYVFTLSGEGKLLDWTVSYTGDAVQEFSQKQSLYHLPPDAYEFVPARVNGKPVESKLTYVVPLTVDHKTEEDPANNTVTKHSVQ